mmetsp:Transcript_2767/g.2403  ORF Transcript_2767/g.2403 Transcript_2767/m.2403 type:complete len:142 (+) Transcript_2767:1023-1448(+)|eukprot:CAMPEP_0114578932 /NCGR_PEP_ID=MMETSP0125-20121206/3406_1 /TAXON_ID=485358 ORGANISM="Aristerostoma sp., Strain ATCC 50986" /NCGR_SAMPLE_ID=MMETSP0125 /ASSEMBLY_ACC=CAM_ASM_000245 /LENGTH=141 /DNA_ID=CAMNT_0001769365 /DNA_START=936 /DNA_END=1361 /DNA_ORIENTATION=+
MTPLHYNNVCQSNVREILLNLIGNSIKFTDKGAITVKVKFEDEQAIEKVDSDSWSDFGSAPLGSSSGIDNVISNAGSIDRYTSPQLRAVERTDKRKASLSFLGSFNLSEKEEDFVVEAEPDSATRNLPRSIVSTTSTPLKE